MFGNKEVYRDTLEFDRWAYGVSLGQGELFVITQYLDKQRQTLEAGTGGGRILFAMKELGYQNLRGYDFLPDFIEQAKQRDKENSITFDVEDATNLSYKNNFFDQLIYFGHFICSIEDERERWKAFKESYRILKPSGIILFSFLCFDTRVRHPIYKLYIEYLRMFRNLSTTNRSAQYLPWLKFGSQLNFLSLIDRGPCVYWFALEEVHQLLKEVGFEVLAIGTDHQISQGKMCDSLESLSGQPLSGSLFVVCRK